MALIAVHLTGVHVTPVRLTAVHLTAVRLTAVHLTAVRLTAVHLTAVRLTAVHLTAVHVTLSGGSAALGMVSLFPYLLGSRPTPVSFRRQLSVKHV